MEGDLQRFVGKQFPLDRYDGSAWIGLVFLTERKVGPWLFRNKWTTFTHHGLNLRTYVKTKDLTGIHFASLECNNVFACVAALIFGMPYRLATIVRTYLGQGLYAMRTSRVWNLSAWLFPWLPSNFQVECEWEVDGNETTVSEEMSSFFVERYNVFTRKYGLNWVGSIDHEPWLCQKASLRKLKIQNVDRYYSMDMRPLLRYIKSVPPSSVLASEGVGPIPFQMLRPLNDQTTQSIL